MGLWAWLKSRANSAVQAAGGLVQPVSFTTRQPTTQSVVPPIPTSLLNSLGIGGQTTQPTVGNIDFGAQLDNAANIANGAGVQVIPGLMGYADGSQGAAYSGAELALARTIWGEARGEGYAGMQAVANVIMNRVYSSRFPNTVEGVCYQPNQFSMWNAGDPNGAKAMAATQADQNFANALDIATKAVAGRLPDLTGGALHYYANSIAAPYWVAYATGQVQIGNHIFVQGVA